MNVTPGKQQQQQQLYLHDHNKVLHAVLQKLLEINH